MKQRDRKLDDLTPTLAAYIVWRAISYLQNSRKPEDWPFVTDGQPLEQAITILTEIGEELSLGGAL